MLVCNSLLIVIAALLAVAFLTLLERKLMAIVQLRVGPNVIGLFGLLQPIADGLKLLTKSTILPLASSTVLFILSPLAILFFSLLVWSVMPFGPGLVASDLNLGIMFLLACSSLNVHAVAFAGWSSQSAYALLGSMRSVAQLVSYELVLSSVILAVLALTESLNISVIGLSQISSGWYGSNSLLCLLPVYLVSLLAETNRAPFDLPEAEAELVAGYNIEYGGGAFALFFLAEYSAIIVFSLLGAICFLGAWGNQTLWVLQAVEEAFKASLFVMLVIVCRAAYPRYRFDQLMLLGWKVLLPFTFGYCVLLFCLLSVWSFDALKWWFEVLIKGAEMKLFYDAFWSALKTRF